MEKKISSGYNKYKLEQKCIIFVKFLMVTIMAIHIRQEQSGDGPIICNLIKRAFAGVLESDHREQFLVERLHQSSAFVPQLSLVGETEHKKIAGYILLTEVEIVSEERTAISLGVAPLAVLPQYQRQGIGGLLLQEAHRRAAMLEYGSAVLLGHQDYYPRFGYRRAIDFGIRFPFDVPDECCMVIELQAKGLDGVCGTVRYPDAFFQ